VSGRLKIHLKANERIFVNGAVIKVDRKVALELMNEVVFLMESHVMQQEAATTPLRQLYFVVQSMLMEPGTIGIAHQIYEQQHRLLLAAFKDQDVLEGLVEVRELIGRGKAFEALKRLRSLFPVEDELMGQGLMAAESGRAVA
jgi:flagellar protein FlbT